MKAYTLGLPLLAVTAALVPAMASAERATGGSVTHFDQYALHTFDQPGAYSFTPNEALSVDLLLVAGGGAGGPQGGGGGGAGQVVVVTNLTLQAGVTYAVIVGDGGRSDQIYDTWEWNVANGGNGGNSSFGDVESENYTGVLALGGGGGGGWGKAGVASANSGGSSIWCGSTASTLAEGGHAGGGTSYGAFGGGAGAGGNGGTPLANEGPAGDGGAGVLLDFTGVPTWYAGGGGASGGASDSAIVAPGRGGSGIGGDGSAYNSGENGGAGLAGTGSGGGGGSRGPNDTLRMCGGAGGSGVVVVKYADTFAEGQDPILGTPGVANVGEATVTSSMLVISPGLGETQCDVSFVYGLVDGIFTYTNSLGSAAAMDRVSVPLSGFAPGRTYYAKYFATNGNGGRSETAVFSFTTAAEVASGVRSPYAGLTQARYDGTAWDFDILAESDKAQVPGIVMANVDKVTPYVNPFDGLSYSWPIAWNAPEITYAYQGYIYLDAAETYTFGVYVDEYIYLYIDEVLFLNRVGGWTTKNYTPETTGWHSLRAYIPGGSYDKGARGKSNSTTTWDNTLGLAFRTDGVTAALPQSAWTPVVDSGNGTLLSTLPGFRSIGMPTWSYANGQFSASLTFGGAATLDATLVAVHGATWGGDDLSAWGAQETLGTVATTDVSRQVSALAIPATDRYVRFALVFPAASGLVPAWSETAALSEASLPSITSSGARNIDGDCATLTGTLSAIGAGATSATVTVEYGTVDGALATATVGVYSVPSDVFHVLENLVPETTYRYRFLVSNTQGGVAVTQFETFTTPGASVMAQAVSSTQNQQSVTLAGTLTVLGAGTTTLYLRMGPDAESMETVATQTATEAGLFTFVETVAYSNSYAYAFSFTNSCAGQTWSGESNVGTFDCLDKVTYYRRAGEDVWDNTEKWWSYSSGDIVGYPTFGATAEFQREASNAVVHVRQPERFQSLVIGSGALGIRIVGDTQDAGLTFADLPNWNGGASVEFDGLPVRCTGEVVHGAGTSFVFSNGAAYEARVHSAGNSNACTTVTSNATMTLSNNMTLGWFGSSLDIDGTDVTIGGTLFFGPDQMPADATGAMLRFHGKSPTLRIGNCLMCYRSDRASPTIEFDIPREGYTSVPLAPVEGNTKRLGNTEWPNSNVPIVLRVPPEAEVVKGAKSVNQLLIDWPRGIDTNSFVFGDVPNLQNDYFYWGPLDREEGAEPTQLWVRVQATGGLTLILLR